MLNDVRDFDARGDGVTDDREAIQAAIDDAVHRGRSGILIPHGVYRLSRPTDPHTSFSLDLDGVRGFSVVGEGPRSVVKLADTSAATSDWHVFGVRNASRQITFANLVVDGNRSGLTAPNEQ